MTEDTARSKVSFHGQSDPSDSTGAKWPMRLAKTIGMLIVAGLIAALVNKYYVPVCSYTWRTAHRLPSPAYWLYPLGAAILAFLLLFSWRAINEIVDQDDLLSDSQQRMEVALKLVSFLAMFASDNAERLIRGAGSADVLREVVRMQLRSAQAIFHGEIFRACVFLREDDYLRQFVGEQMPEPDGYERRFYVGKDGSTNRGIAGLAYVQQEVVECHADPVGGDWEFTCPHYVRLDGKRHHTQYRAIIAAPLMDIRDGECLGVICLDSQNEDAFSAEGVQTLVFFLGVVIARTFALADLVEEMNGQPT